MGKAPSWGKAIGIIMICLGGLGVFTQLYKFIFVQLFSMIPRFPQQQMMEQGMGEFQRENINQFSRMFEIAPTDVVIVKILAGVGILLTVFYIIGGTKLLTAKPAHYNYGKYVLTAFMLYNAFGVVYFYSNVGNMFFMIFMFYVLIGFLFDLTLLIILLKSDKSKYGIGSSTADPEVYTVDNTDNRIINKDEEIY